MAPVALARVLATLEPERRAPAHEGLGRAQRLRGAVAGAAGAQRADREVHGVVRGVAEVVGVGLFAHFAGGRDDG